MTRYALPLLLTLVLPALSGCHVTALEHLPEGTTTACDDGWKGAWIGVDDDGDADTGVLIGDDCRVTLIAADPDEKPTKPMTPHFLDNVVLFSAREATEALGEDVTAVEEKWQDAHIPYRVSRPEGRLELDAPDHRRVATLIVNGAFDGDVEWSRNSSSNLIKGDPVELRRILSDVSLFGDEDPIRLRRVGDDRRDVERALKKALRAQERRK